MKHRVLSKICVKYSEQVLNEGVLDGRKAVWSRRRKETAQVIIIDSATVAKLEIEREKE